MYKEGADTESKKTKLKCPLDPPMRLAPPGTGDYALTFLCPQSMVLELLINIC